MDLTIPAYIAIIALGILVAVHSVILLGVVRIVSELQQPRRGEQVSAELVAGEEAPGFTGVDLDGGRVSSEEFAGRVRVLLFLSPNCADCSTTLEELKLLNWKGHGNVVAVCAGDQAACKALLERFTPALRVVVDETQQIFHLYQILSFPTAVLVDPDDRIQSYGKPEREAIEAALENQAAKASPVV